MGLGGGLLVILVVVGWFLCVKREWWKVAAVSWPFLGFFCLLLTLHPQVETNEEVYGTYGRGDPEGEYGDGDVSEVVDTNDYYAA